MTARWPKYSLFALLIVLVLVMIVPWLIPADTYISRAEQQLSQAAHRKVTIGSLRFSLLPRIKLVASNVRLAGNKAEGDLTVEHAYLYPDLASLFSETPKIHDIHLAGVRTQQTLLMAMARQPAAADKDASRVQLKRISVSDLYVLVGENRLGPYRLKLQLSGQGLNQLLLEQDEGDLELVLDKVQQGYRIQATAEDWRPPLVQQMAIQSLQTEGVLHRNGVHLDSLRLQMFDGEVQGEATLDWTDAWRLQGQLVLSEIDIAPVLTLLGTDNSASGLISGSMKLQADAAAPGQLLHSLQMQGQAHVTNAVVNTAGTGLAITNLQSSFSLQPSHLVLTSMESEFYHGKAMANQVQIDWADGWHLQGDLQLQQVDAEPLLHVFGKERVISGQLGGTFRYSAQAQAPAGLQDAFINSGDFRFVDGVIYDIDLVAAAKGAGKEAMRGKNTAYQEFRGHLEVKNRQRELTNLSITSDLLEASGKVSIDTQDKLSGKINVSLRKTLSVAGVNLNISGTLQEPQASLPTTTKAGAAIGTVLGGPGVGTAVGAKVGETVESVGDFIGGLFGGKKKEETKNGDTAPTQESTKQPEPARTTE
jgi:uncharacterized protein involved in outer membrane biogenesis